MERPTITITDHITGETVTRELNDQEYSEFLSKKQEWEERIALIEQN